MLTGVVCGQTPKTRAVGIDNANLITGLCFEYLTNENDLASWLRCG